ncbi:histidine phosphatase family protein [Streptomyces abikoensis]|uniref:histidine phosphatase family protein n=1 Tax=Streptomyces abikoensis TaxID=97398 RepID=UPI0033EA3EC6
MITTELVFVRHGEAQCNVDGVVGGPVTCTGLTGHGQAQVTLAAARLAAEHCIMPFTALYAGPRIRLRQTGEVLGQALGLPVRTDTGLDGPVHGAADGKPWAEVKTAAGGGPHTHPDQPWAEGSDTWNGYLQRAGAFLRDLIARHQGDRLLFAAHGETVIAAHTLLLGLGPGTDAGFAVSHASISQWQHHRNRLGQDRWLLNCHNDTAHLARPATGPTP